MSGARLPRAADDDRYASAGASAADDFRLRQGFDAVYLRHSSGLSLSRIAFASRASAARFISHFIFPCPAEITSYFAAHSLIIVY